MPSKQQQSKNTVFGNTITAIIVVICFIVEISVSSCVSFDNRPSGDVIPINDYVGSWKLETNEGDINFIISQNGVSGTLATVSGSAGSPRIDDITRDIEIRRIDGVVVVIISENGDDYEMFRMYTNDNVEYTIHGVNKNTIENYINNDILVKDSNQDNMFGFSSEFESIHGEVSEITDFVQDPNAFVSTGLTVRRIVVADGNSGIWREKSYNTIIVYALGAVFLMASLFATYIVARRSVDKL